MDDALSSMWVVVWTDAWFDHDESAPEDWTPNFVVTSIGFLVRDGAEVLSLAHEVLPDGQYRAVTHIPRSLVVSTTELSKGAGTWQEPHR